MWLSSLHVVSSLLSALLGISEVVELCPQLRQVDLSGCLGVTDRMLDGLQQVLARQVEEDMNYGEKREQFFLAIGGIFACVHKLPS